MPRPRRTLHATALQTTTPPATLSSTQTIARVIRAAGNNLYLVELPPLHPHSLPLPLRLSPPIQTQTQAPPSPPPTSPATTPTTPTTPTTLAELPPRFRHTIWLKRGSFVLLDTGAFSARDNKIGGEIANVVREEKEWRRMAYWPAAFVKAAVPVGEVRYGGGGSGGSESGSGSDAEEDVVGKLPPGFEEEDEESEEEADGGGRRDG